MHADVDVVLIQLDAVAGRRDPQLRHIRRWNVAEFLNRRSRQSHAGPVGQLDVDRISVRIVAHTHRAAFRRPTLPIRLDGMPEFVGSGRRNLHGSHCSTPTPAFIARLVPSFMISVACLARTPMLDMICNRGYRRGRLHRHNREEVSHAALRSYLGVNLRVDGSISRLARRGCRKCTICTPESPNHSPVQRCSDLRRKRSLW